MRPFKRRLTHDEQLAEIHKEYGPPPLTKDACDICGKTANTELTWYFRPSPLTGAKRTYGLCDEHGRILTQTLFVNVGGDDPFDQDIRLREELWHP